MRSLTKWLLSEAAVVADGAVAERDQLANRYGYLLDCAQEALDVLEPLQGRKHPYRLEVDDVIRVLRRGVSGR